MRFSTPLRYPGGKGRLARYVSDLIEMNNLTGGGYAEPFCGGAGIALSLLIAEKVSDIYLNDIDRSVYAFWYAVVEHNEELCQRIRETPVTLETWHAQKSVQKDKATADLLDLAFSTFFLNRTNRSGILNAGVIGGQNQTGKWKIGARYDKTTLIERIDLLRFYAKNIHVSNDDVGMFIGSRLPEVSQKCLVYFDPPYFRKADRLYTNHFSSNDHAQLASIIQDSVTQPWIVSYDNTPEIAELYNGRRQEAFPLSYSASAYSLGSELMIFKDGIDLPPTIYTTRSMVA